MLQFLNNKLKEQKGFTLIELLAVIVILGILAAIAVPSILGLIQNTKDDAHVANAQQMVSAAKMAVASESDFQTGQHYLSLGDLETKNYLDTVDSPDATEYIKTKPTTDFDNTSFVKINNGKVVLVKLVTTEKGLSVGLVSTATSVSTKDIKRSSVKKIANLPTPTPTN